MKRPLSDLPATSLPQSDAIQVSVITRLLNLRRRRRLRPRSAAAKAAGAAGAAGATDAAGGPGTLSAWPSRLGVHVAFIATFALLGGALRGFNLLLILAGLLVGVLILQWRLCRRIVEVVRVHRLEPPEAFAGTPFVIQMVVHNTSRWLPVWLVMLHDSVTPAVESSVRGAATATSGVGFVPAGTKRQCSYQCRIGGRGRYRIGPMVLTTGFPLGLSTARRQVLAEAVDLYVYPRLLQLAPRWESVLESRTGGLAVTAKRSGISEGDFYGLREWQNGDSQRWIHWRTTARLDELAVRQFEQQRRHEICLVVDASRDPACGADEAAIERAIELAATLLVKLTQAPTNRVTLVVAGRDVETMTVTGAGLSIQRAMRALAEVETAPRGELVAALSAGIEMTGSDRPIVVLSPTAADPRRFSSAELDLHAEQLDLRWLDITSPVIRNLVRGEPSDAAT